LFIPTASATAPSWSVAGLVHVPARDAFVIISSQQWSPQLGGVALAILSTTPGVGLSSPSACLGCDSSYTHIHTTGMALPLLGYHGPGTPTSASTGPRIGGPSCTLRLHPNGGYAGNPGMMMGAMRGHCVRPDGNGTCPSAVDSVPGVNCVSATLFIADGPEIM
jgi:hypothetical protein